MLSLVHHTTASRSPEPAPSRRASPAPLVTVVAVGDVMLDRGPGGKIRRGGPEVVFRRVLPLLEDADVRFCNLECPLSATGPHDPMNLVFRAEPRAVQALVHGGFDAVSLANNHSFNAGRQGLYNTVDTLRSKGILYAGAHGRDEPRPPCATFEIEGLRLGFLAYTEFKPSPALLNEDTLDAVCAQISAAAASHDLLFVSVHWGDEYRRTPTDRQVRFGHAMVDAGADVILGHHPHVLEGVEVYKGKVICYSLGNFVFDQRDVEPMESAVFRFRWRREAGLQLWLTPVWIPRATFAPQPCQRERADKILARLERMCAGLGTELQIVGEQAVLTAYQPPGGDGAGGSGGATRGE
ncbi:MAG: CapA family protein [Armatimonadota bacterium]